MIQGLLRKDQQTKALKEYITFRLTACTRKLLGAIVRTNVESVIEKFENIDAVSRKLTELRKSPSLALVKEILKLGLSKTSSKLLDQQLLLNLKLHEKLNPQMDTIKPFIPRNPPDI